VNVEGKLKTEEWEKDGVKRYTTRIRVTTMNMMDRASNNSTDTTSPQSKESNQTIAKQNEDAIEIIIDGEDDDLPF
jgi:single-strand DNA-binding protein